jgi:hypothetical protein
MNVLRTTTGRSAEQNQMPSSRPYNVKRAATTNHAAARAAMSRRDAGFLARARLGRSNVIAAPSMKGANATAPTPGTRPPAAHLPGVPCRLWREGREEELAGHETEEGERPACQLQRDESLEKAALRGRRIRMEDDHRRDGTRRNHSDSCVFRHGIVWQWTNHYTY